jgi:REP element-mobilizing transposase RayT
MTLYQGKYRSDSPRLKGWDYSNPGFYFLTLCTQHRICNLGRIENGKMIDSSFGTIARQEWELSFKIRKELECFAFVLMPNHLHAIVAIKGSVETNGRSPQPNTGKKPIPPRSKRSISSFIAGYKSAVISKINDFIDEERLPIEKYNRERRFWQRNYYDHIIRNERSYYNIKRYIELNPKKWGEDKIRALMCD